MIAAKDYDVALGTQKSNNRAEAVIIKNESSATSTYETVLTLGKDGEYFTINDGNGYLYATTGDNYLREQDEVTDAAKWTITIGEEGNATIKAELVVDILDNPETDKNEAKEAKNIIRYNANNNGHLFSCYASGQKDVVIYKLTN